MPARPALVLTSMLLTACGGGGGGTAGSGGSSALTAPAGAPNQTPVADARASSRVEAGSLVTLDGSASIDPDGSVRRYAWSQTSGVAVGIAGVHGRVATFTAPDVADDLVLGFLLTVVDEDGAAATDQVDVIVQPASHALSGTILAAHGMATDGDVNDPGAPRAPNDVPDAAQRVSVPLIVGGYAAAPGAGAPGPLQQSGDVSDWFRVSLEGGHAVTLSVAEPDVGDLDLYLWAPDGDALLDAATGTGALETLTAASAGDYLLEVAPYGGASSYTLVVGQPVIPGIQSELRLSDDFVPGDIILEKHAATADRTAAALMPMARTGAGAAGRPVLARLGADVLSVPGIARGASLRHPRPAADGLADDSAPDARAAIEGRARALVDPVSRAKLATLLAIKALRLDPSVRYAQPNRRVEAQAVPNDPFYALQWHYPMIDLPRAWELTQGDAAVTVAVLDSGVLPRHPDLAGQLLPGYDFVSSAAAGGDGDGIDDDPTDPGGGEAGSIGSYHGTHVAGTVAAVSGNGIGAAGIAPGVKILPVRVLGARGGSSYDILQGVRYAAGLSNDSGSVAAPVDVINLSLGRLGRCWPAEQAAFDAAREAGVLVVAAAGNDAVDAAGAFPASCAHVFAVGAVGPDGQRASYSNFGASVDVQAPGGRSSDGDGDGNPDGVLSLTGNDADAGLRYTYAFRSGTSMASPHVAGVLALMRSVDATLMPDLIEQLLGAGALTNADGVIDAYQAVSAALNGAGWPPGAGSGLSVAPTALDFGSTYNYVEIDVRVPDEAGFAQATAEVSWLQVAPLPQAGASRRFAIHVDRTRLTAGRYTDLITVTAANGTARIPVSVRVAGSSTTADAGHLYVLLRDPVTGVVVRQTQVSATDGRYVYSFADVPAGRYELLAGTDSDNDGSICDRGESCGIYRDPDGSTAIDVTRDTSGIELTVGQRVSLVEGVAGATRATLRLDAAETIRAPR